MSKTRSSLLQRVSGRQTEQSQVHKHPESLRDSQEGRLGVWIDRTYSRGKQEEQRKLCSQPCFTWPQGPGFSCLQGESIKRQSQNLPLWRED